PFGVTEADRQLVVVTGGPHRGRHQMAIETDLQGLFDHQAVGAALGRTVIVTDHQLGDGAAAGHLPHANEEHGQRGTPRHAVAPSLRSTASPTRPTNTTRTPRAGISRERAIPRSVLLQLTTLSAGCSLRVLLTAFRGISVAERSTIAAGEEHQGRWKTTRRSRSAGRGPCRRRSAGPSW